MTGFETAVSAYIAEHGEIDDTAYATLAKLYKTEGVAGIALKQATKQAAALKARFADNGTYDAMFKTLTKMQNSVSNAISKQLTEKIHAYLDSRVDDVKEQCKKKDLGERNDIVKAYADSVAEAKSEISKAITEITNQFDDLKPDRQEAFQKLIFSGAAVNNETIESVCKMAASRKISVRATNAWLKADEKITSMITVAAAAKKSSQAVSNAAKKGCETVKSGAKKDESDATLDKLASTISDCADKIKNLKEVAFNEVVAGYVSENGTIDSDVYDALRDICDSL